MPGLLPERCAVWQPVKPGPWSLPWRAHRGGCDQACRTLPTRLGVTAGQLRSSHAHSRGADVPTAQEQPAAGKGVSPCDLMI